MRWSKLKQRIEERFSSELHGRLAVHVTRYRHSHDQLFEFWLTFDGQQVAAWSDAKSYAYAYERRVELEKTEGLSFAAPEAWEDMRKTQYLPGDLMRMLFDSLSWSLEAMMNHENPVMRVLGLADNRLGKRRLLAITRDDISALEQRIYDLRIGIEQMAGCRPKMKQTSP